MTNGKSFGLRLEKGASLPTSIVQAAEGLAPMFCDVAGFGALEWVSLSLDDGSEIRRFEGPLQLLSMKGRIRRAGGVSLSDFVCVISRETDNGWQVLGGRLTDGIAMFLELTIIPLEIPEDALPPSPLPSEVTASSPAPKIRESASESATKDRWLNAVEEARRIRDEVDFSNDAEPETKPSRGDIVHHMHFGECNVTRITDEHITLRKPDGRNVQLGLPILTFIPAGSREGKKIFRVEVKPKHR